MAAFDLALARVQQDSGDLLLPDRVNQLARAADHTFRSTKLTPGNTLCLFVRQIAHGNIACSAVRHLAEADFSDSAWCQARDRLPVELVRDVHQRVIDQARRHLDETETIGDGSHRWRGHRVYVVDGTSHSMPDTPLLRDHYGVPSGCRPGLGFPTTHLMLLVDHRSGLLIDCIDSPMNTHDASVASATHPHLRPGDILLGDDAFGGWGHLALLLQGQPARGDAGAPQTHRRLHARPSARAST